MKVLAILTVALALVASDARAEIVVFKNGRSMSVKSVRLDAEVATMMLRAGGEVTFPRNISPGELEAWIEITEKAFAVKSKK